MAESLELTIADDQLPEGISPEAIFAFIYATLHSPAYRARYGAFLKTDFPRVPLPRDGARFEALARLGQTLVALHTLDATGAPALLETRFPLSGEGANTVVKVEYDEAQRFLRFNTSRGFGDVPAEVWNFKIGGYQVARKWLDDRKTRTLSHKDLLHFQKTLIALDETRRLMLEIDAVGVVG